MTDVQLAWAIVSPVIVGLGLVLVYAISRSAGRYDAESERLALTDEELSAALEGALTRELSDISFAAPQRHIEGRLAQ